ncbi:hypothetical protein GCM10027074_17860 [Streptomyces deserti]
MGAQGDEFGAPRLGPVGGTATGAHQEQREQAGRAGSAGAQGARRGRRGGTHACPAEVHGHVVGLREASRARLAQPHQPVPPALLVSAVPQRVHGALPAQARRVGVQAGEVQGVGERVQAGERLPDRLGRSYGFRAAVQPAQCVDADLRVTRVCALRQGREGASHDRLGGRSGREPANWRAAACHTARGRSGATTASASRLIASVEAGFSQDGSAWHAVTTVSSSV